LGAKYDNKPIAHLIKKHFSSNYTLVSSLSVAILPPNPHKWGLKILLNQAIEVFYFQKIRTITSNITGLEPPILGVGGKNITHFYNYNNYSTELDPM
jgi:hypothetical protein